MPVQWDAALRQEFNATLQAVDTILLSRLMVDDYVTHWTGMSRLYPANSDFAFAKRVVDADKVVLTSTSFSSRSARTRVIRGPLAQSVAALKQEPGKDIITFGGVRLVSALLAAGQVDELRLYLNPAALGSGESIFHRGGPRQLKLLGSRAYDCGIVVNSYVPGAKM
jgi:dihydrofolate reductase